MVITIKEGGSRFGARVGAIIYNEDRTKVLLENQENGRYMFPGGRIDVHEDSNTAIVRELKEELKLETKPRLILISTSPVYSCICAISIIRCFET